MPSGIFSTRSLMRTMALVLAAMSCKAALAVLPAPTPEQAQAAEAKKKQAAEQAAKEKQELAASMDKVAARWRERAKANGWEVHPATPVAAPGAADAAPPANPPAPPIRSEKAGTAPPSEDVKDPAKKGK